eukprot:6328394-Pyramimonas_sp.AAC.1
MGVRASLFVRSFLRPVEWWRDRLYEGPSLYQSKLSKGEVPLARAASIMARPISARSSDASI